MTRCGAFRVKDPAETDEVAGNDRDGTAAVGSSVRVEAGSPPRRVDVTLGVRHRLSPSSQRRHWFFWVAAAAAPLCAAICVSAALAIWRYGPYVQNFGWTAVATRH